MLAVGGRKIVHPRTELHDAEPIAGAHFVADARAAHHAAREHADDLPRHDHLAAVIDPDLAPLVRAAGLVAVGGEKSSGQVVDGRDAPGRRDAVDVHVHRRQEDADLLPWHPARRRRRVRHRRPGDQHAAVRGRQHDIRIRRRDSVRITKEENEEQPEDDERDRAAATRDGRARDRGEQQRAADERQARGIRGASTGRRCRRRTVQPRGAPAARRVAYPCACSWRCRRRMSSIRSLSWSLRFLRVTSSTCSGSER